MRFINALQFQWKINSKIPIQNFTRTNETEEINWTNLLNAADAWLNARNSLAIFVQREQNIGSRLKQ